MKKLAVMLMVLAISAPAFGGIIAQENFDSGINNDWDVFNGTPPATFNLRDSVGHHTGGNYPAGNPAFGGSGVFDSDDNIFHWNSATPLFETNAARTFEMWVSPTQDGAGWTSGAGYGGALLTLDASSSSLFRNGNLFLFNNLNDGGYRLFFQSDAFGTIESVNTIANWAADSWNHVTVSWDATNFMVGYNGIVMANVAHGGLGSWDWDSSGAGGYMMSHAWAGNFIHNFNGRADDITVSDTGHYAQYYSSYPVPTAPIPEPVTLSLLGLGSLAVLRRRRS